MALTALEKKRLSRLKRRQAFLEKRIAENKSKDLSYDKGEVASLAWAVEELERRIGNVRSTGRTQGQGS